MYIQKERQVCAMITEIDFCCSGEECKKLAFIHRNTWITCKVYENTKMIIPGFLSHLSDFESHHSGE